MGNFLQEPHYCGVPAGRRSPSISAFAGEPCIHLVLGFQPIVKLMARREAAALGDKVGGLGNARLAILMNMRRDASLQHLSQVAWLFFA